MPIRSMNTSRPNRRQQGAGALALVLILMGAASLATLWMSRTLWTEQRGLAAQVHGVVAQETAQFGLDRAWALLHEARVHDAACQARTAPPGTGAERDALQRLLAAPAGAAVPLIACARLGASWSCQCPGPGGAGAPWLPVGDREAFAVEASVESGGRAPMLRVTATACAEGGVACAASDAARAPTAPSRAATASVARLVADLALRGALAAEPAAAIVAGGNLRLGAGASGRVHVVNTDADSHGLVLHAGGTIDPGSARVTGLPGAAAASALAAEDAALARADVATRLGTWLGSAPGRWREWPRVVRLECGAAGCDGAALDALLDQGHRAIAVGGPLRWSPARPARAPFVLLVEGALELSGPAQLEATLLAHELHLRNTSTAPLELRGAVVAAGDITVDGQVTVARDAAVLAELRDLPLALGRVSGRWRAVPLP